LEEEAQNVRKAVRFASRAAARAMKDKILDSPTGSKWHSAINSMRGNPDGARLETGTMYDAVASMEPKIVENADRRRQSAVVGGFGWPADANGNIKDASPRRRSQADPDGDWRTDPKYFMMQEYGFDLDGDFVPGMHAQQAGVEAFKTNLDEYWKKRGYK
jgi:hypothetical protein